MPVTFFAVCEPHVVPALDNPPSISARELHEVLLVAHSAGNTARRRFIDALRALDASRLYHQLGFPSVCAYADATFRYQRSQVYEFLRVSKALLDLPRIASAFERGDLSWSLVSELTRVADEEVEGEWLDFLRGRSVRGVLAELRDARKKNRLHPRKDGYGLPGQPVKLTFELSPEDHAVVARGLEKVSSEMRRSLDGARPSPVEALLYLLRRVLETNPAGSITDGRKESEASPFLVCFHQCPDCRRSAVETAEGRVEVSPGAVERCASGAEEIVIDPEKSPVPTAERDRPNTPALRRALRWREGGRCANPHCRRETGVAGHGHHIQLRSEGGRTELSNELWLCVRCHALLHSSSLEVKGNSETGLVWNTRADDITRTVWDALERGRGLPEVWTLEVPHESRGLDSPPSSIEDDVIEALKQLDCSQAEAETRLEKAWSRLQGVNEDPGDVSAECLLREAVRGGR